RPLDGPGTLPHAPALRVRAASALPGLHHRILGGARDDGRTFAVRGRHHGLHPRRHPARGARSHRRVRRRVPPLQAPRLDAGAVAQVGLSVVRDRVRAMIEDVRGRIDYQVAGAGPTIVLAPGSCSTGAAWRPVMAAWDDRFRCVTTSLLGYGTTAERRSAHDPSIWHGADVLEKVIRAAGEP